MSIRLADALCVRTLNTFCNNQKPKWIKRNKKRKAEAAAAATAAAQEPKKLPSNDILHVQWKLMSIEEQHHHFRIVSILGHLPLKEKMCEHIVNEKWGKNGWTSESIV